MRDISSVLDSANQMQNAESTLDSAESQNLVKNNRARSANPFKSFCYFWLLPKVESPLSFNYNLPNKVDSQNLIKNNPRVSANLVKASSGVGEGVVREGEGSDFAIQAPTPSLKKKRAWANMGFKGGFIRAGAWKNNRFFARSE